MKALKKSVAEKTLAELPLGKSNRAVADHWLSLWQGDTLPSRAAFSPAKLKAQLPNLLVFDVVPDERVTVRLAGTNLRDVLGKELTGRDWVAEAPESHRPTRLRNMSAVARGAVLITHRRSTMAVGDDTLNEELALPFAPEPDGVHPVMVHVDWKLDRISMMTAVTKIEPDARDFTLLALA